MPVDGGGVITRPASPVPVDGQTAQAAEVNVPTNDIYNVLNMLMFLDGRKSLRGNIPMNGYKASNAANATAPQDYVTLSQVQAMIAAVSQLFPGYLMTDTATSTAAPDGWLYANGQEVLRATYPALWARVSATGGNLAATQGAKTAGQYGPGNGTTTFTLPNLYADGGYFIRPVTAGRAIGSLQIDEFKSHAHIASTDPSGIHQHEYVDASVVDPGSLSGNGPFAGVTNINRTTSFSGSHIHTVNVQNTGGQETRPINVAYPVLIKT